MSALLTSLQAVAGIHHKMRIPPSELTSFKFLQQKEKGEEIVNVNTPMTKTAAIDTARPLCNHKIHLRPITFFHILDIGTREMIFLLNGSGRREGPFR
jgi:hypothetical protein